MTPREAAERAQLSASNPHVSAFVGASAGSGKTKLLIDRLLRLLMAGADPTRIQCLTFTKAAAAEMSLRLQQQLARWFVLDDARLAAELTGLDIPTDAARLARARALFVRVLDVPGGMRISTLHAFCQSLLRRFPLEAQISPHFALLEESEAAGTLRAAREDLFTNTDAEQDEAIRVLAGLCKIDAFGGYVKELLSKPERLSNARAATDAARYRRLLGVEVEDEAALMAQAVAPPGEAALWDAARTVMARGTDSTRLRAERMLGWLSEDRAERAELWDEWSGCFIKKSDGEVYAARGFANPNLLKAWPALADPMLAEGARIQRIQATRRALLAARVSSALARLAAPILEGYRHRKTLAGRLDYDDLVAHTVGLLREPGAAWVLYKLDGGLDHILLDEVQDTAPAQWEIAHKLTEEFFAGQGARDVERTIFAVGDRKQSIFSFQGANAEAFDSNREKLGRRVEAFGKDAWLEVPLDVSFRSTAPVLALVDAVFADPMAALGVVPAGTSLRHTASRTGAAGSVELWPLLEREAAEEPEAWQVAKRNQGGKSASDALAERIAGYIQARIQDGAVLESQGRPVQAGDFLILVRRRGSFAPRVVRALKARGVAVAGMDRMVLAEQPAVADLLSLCDTLLLPEDDLSLATVLRSPLGGVSEQGLYDLAADRKGSLWAALSARAAERADWGAAFARLSRLAARVDYATPHALLAEALGAQGGRARLLARFGAEAEEPVDELLEAALSFQQSQPPSLQGFVAWVRAVAAELKRDQGGHGGIGEVRVMTAHGAKGLQAPIVIVPDTTGVARLKGDITWIEDPANPGAALPVLSSSKALRCTAVEEARAVLQIAQEAEHNRLLYVALTRAEDRLIVCGWQTGKTVNEKSWYACVRRGFDRLGAAAGEDGVLRHASPQADRVPPPPPRAARAAAPPPPAWAGRAPLWQAGPVPAEATPTLRLAPSRPQDVMLGTVPESASPLARNPLAQRPLAERDAAGNRFRRGQLVHTLLQHLPHLPEADREAAAAGWLRRQDADPHIAAEVMAVLRAPDLAPLFGPASRAETPLTGVVGGQVIGGLVDRLAVLPERVLLADYKTNRDAPADAESTPVLYLRQMAAYRAVLRLIYPDRPVTAILIWTRAVSGRVGAHVLPDALLERYAPA